MLIIPPCNVAGVVGKIRSMCGGGDSRGISCSFSTLCYTDFKRCEKKYIEVIMKTKYLFFSLLVSFFFFSCSLDSADNVDSFPTADYSSLVKSDCYKIGDDVKALAVLNLFYDTFGYGEFDISGTASHSESATLIGVNHTETIACNINHVKIYHINNSTSGETVSSFYVDFTNENGEVLSYCYKWQYHNTNAWKNGKTSTWFISSDWYKKADDKTKTAWTIVINKN